MPEEDQAPARPSAPSHAGPRLSRRAFLGAAGGGAAAIGLAGVGGFALAGGIAESPPSGARTYPFHGPHQAGIVTPAQDRMYTTAFDLTTTSRDELLAMLRRWTIMSARLTRGLPAGPTGSTSGPYDAPPEDTGEAMDLPAAGLTITLGFGRSLFVGTADEPTDRFGLADRLPAALIALPHFPRDDIDPARSDGDIVVQACADDPQVAVHAIRNLTRSAFGTARVRWSQLGYGRTSSTSQAQLTPRNLFGFKDGTANIKAEETAELDRHVWVKAADDTAASWMAGGTYMVARRIRMIVETWDRSSLREQEGIIGRTKAEGAPLSGGSETTDPDFDAPGRAGEPLITETAHVRLAHPTSNGGARMLRRGYTFTDGDDGLGRLDAGLFFVAFVRDARTQFVPMQTALARSDALSEYLVHKGSGVYAVPPGVPSIGDDGSLVGDAIIGGGLFT